MTSLEAYNSFLIKVNKNDTNRNINIPKGQFVFLYNQQAPIWLSTRIEKDINTDRINDIKELLQLDVSFTKYQEYDRSTDFLKPEDYFEYSNSYSVAERPGCLERVLYNFDIKNKNRNTLFINTNQKPSFDYQETSITAYGDYLKVYTDNFKVTKLYVDYYKTPPLIDIEGYINVDGTHSTNKNPRLSNYLVNQILDFCALETSRIYTNAESFSVSQERVQKEI